MSEIIAHHLRDSDEISIYDPTSGSGSLLINIGQAVSKYLGNRNKIKYYAQELIPETYNLTRMNLVMRDILPGNIVARQGDTLDKDWPYFEDGNPDSSYDYLSVDACCSNPPYSQPWDPKNGPRFDDYGLAPKSKADYAFLLHNLYHLKKDGIMTIVLPHGVLFRGGEEAVIRENLIKKHNIETIIGLPPNLFYGTSIPTIIVVLKKKREKDDILFIDASKGFIKDGNKNKLRQRDIRRIVDTVIERREEPNYSRIVSYDEIKHNEFNLNIPRYVDSNIQEIPCDLYALMNGGIPNREIDELKSFWEVFPTLRSQLFSSSSTPYSTLNTEDIIATIECNREVKTFVQQHESTFAFLKGYLEQRLLTDPSAISIGAEEAVIARRIRDSVDPNGLIDYYDCFEVLDDEWQAIALDLETIKEEGLGSAREVDEVKVLKKDSKTKRLEEKVIGSDGKLIPFWLIQRVYLNDLAGHFNTLENELNSLTAEKDELLESIDPEDKTELLKQESEDIDTKKLKAKIADIKKKLKKGAEFEEGSYEAVLLAIDETNEKISNLKKEIRIVKTDLFGKTEAKIRSLTDEEIHDCLIAKWIEPICAGINGLSKQLIKSLEKAIKELAKKYEFTLTGIDKEISKVEAEVSSMIDDLEGDDYGLKGLQILKKLLLGGDK